MIKNDNQLAVAQKKIRELQQLIQHMSDRYTGLELELLRGGLVQQLQDIQSEIDEYRELKELSLEQALETTLRQPVLIDQIGELLAKIRLAAGLTQLELAERLGWQQANVSRFENENYTSQTLYKIVEYATALGVWLHVFPSLSDETEAPQWYESAEEDERRQEFPQVNFTKDDWGETFEEYLLPYGRISWVTTYDEPAPSPARVRVLTTA